MNYFNFKISSKQGEFYQSSSTPQEGYQAVEYGTPVKTTYHKYYKSLAGTVNSFGVKEVPYEGKTLKFLQLSLKDGENLYQISVTLNNQKGTNYSDEAKALIGAMRGYKAGEPVRASVSYKTTTSANGKEYKNCNFYLNYENIKNDAGKNASTGYIPFDEIPRAEVEEVAGEKSYTFKAQKNFYYGILMELSEKFKYESAPAMSPAPSPTAEPSSTGTAQQPVVAYQQEAPPTAAAIPTGKKDDLPF
jgi:hypothetical protein